MRVRHGLSPWIVVLLAAGWLPGAEPVDYLRQIKPILARCTTCHGVLEQEASLRADTAELLLRGGDSGPAVVPGKSGESSLIAAVTGQGEIERMPLDAEPLDDEQIALLRRWIDEGAQAPPEKALADPRDHWAFRPPVRPAVPSQPSGVQNRIDAFLSSELDKQGLRPAPPAPKHVLLRRVYLDLIGLPPTRAELKAFLTDSSPEAYEKVVDRLLASPHYGERWGRHWMDVWRYSDWDGYGAEVRESKPHIWRWRDWIVESLNADRGYHQMIVEMLAADEAAPEDASALRATGFLVRNWFLFNRNTWLDNTVEHSSKAFLGITLNCARCHDHKYDPISQAEYYQFRAIFEPHNVRTDRVPGEADTAKDGLVRVYDADAQAQTFLFVRGDDKQPDKEHPLQPRVPQILGGELAIEPVSLSPLAYYPGLRPFEQQETLAQVSTDVQAAETALNSAQQALAAARQKATELADAAKPTPEAQQAPEPFLDESFASAQSERWQVGSGQWEYKDGRLFQSEVSDRLSRVTSVQPHARNFRATFRFKITGGNQWKSVGLSFDADEEQHFHGVYLSANAPGPKLQIFHRQAGQDSYPAEAAQALSIETGREYELQVAVRERLVNVSVDGQLQLVYQLPNQRRESGRLALWTYDATAEFIRFTAETLSDEAPLVEKPGGAPTAPAIDAETLAGQVRKAEVSLAVAEQRASAARAALAAVEARIAADNAALAAAPPANANEPSMAAVKAERQANLLRAQYNVSHTEQQLAAARETAKPEDEAAKKKVTELEAKLAELQKAREAAQQALKQPAENYSRFGEVYPATSTGRRLALARWITARDNPLAARVAVNHIWLRHFGAPLVPTVFDFGLNGKPPTHPELLDWLAVDLMDNGWRMKRLHRLIVTSEAYRRSSSAGVEAEPNRSRDPENTMLWRMNVRRMEAEIVRDSTLAVAGSLDRTLAGPELDHNLGLTVPRRSIYFRSAKEKRMTFLSLFDSANVVECYRRTESVVPQQALAMVNSSLTLAQSRRIATTLSAETGPAAERDPAFVQVAFEQVLGREATAEERAECEKFLGEQTARFQAMDKLTPFAGEAQAAIQPASDPHQRARENLVHVLLNHNDFVTIR